MFTLSIMDVIHRGVAMIFTSLFSCLVLVYIMKNACEELTCFINMSKLLKLLLRQLIIMYIFWDSPYIVSSITS